MFCSVKIHVDRVKRQATDWKEIFANRVSDKGLQFGRLSWADHLSPGVRDQPRQHGETLSLHKMVQNSARCDGILGDSRQRNHTGHQRYSFGRRCCYVAILDLSPPERDLPGFTVLAVKLSVFSASNCLLFSFWGWDQPSPSVPYTPHREAPCQAPAKQPCRPRVALVTRVAPLPGISQSVGNKNSSEMYWALKTLLGQARWVTPVIPALWDTEASRSPELLRRLRDENLLNLGGRGCSESRSCHCTFAWATRAKRCLNQSINKTILMWSGSHIRWGQPFRLRHVTTGKYLSLMEDKNLLLMDKEKADVKSTAFTFRSSKHFGMPWQVNLANMVKPCLYKITIHNLAGGGACTCSPG
ncbi:Ryanodine receptor 2, partial [Plecturocebus cupreus]